MKYLLNVIILLFIRKIPAEFYKYGPGEVYIELSSLLLNHNDEKFQCYKSNANVFNYGGGCNLDIYIYLCSIELEDTTNYVDDWKETYKFWYANRYSNEHFKYLLKKMQEIFSTKPGCVAHHRPFHLFNVMRTNFLDNLTMPKVYVNTKKFSQKVVVFLGIVSNDIYVYQPPSAVWFADFWNNSHSLPNYEVDNASFIAKEADLLDIGERFVVEVPNEPSNIFRQKPGRIIDTPDYEHLIVLRARSVKYGYNEKRFGIFPVSVFTTLTTHFGCQPNYYGPMCGVRCVSSEKGTCDPVTGNMTCNQGWLSKLEETETIIGPQYLVTCDFKDVCFGVNCNNNEICIRTDEDLYECLKLVIVINPSDICAEVGTSFKCSLDTNFTFAARWLFNEEHEHGVRIRGDVISFNQAIGRTQNYTCEIELYTEITPQILSKTFQFFIYENNYRMLSNIYDGTVIYGDIIECFVENWNMHGVDFEFIADDPTTLYLEKVSPNSCKVLPDSTRQLHSMICSGHFKRICPNNVMNVSATFYFNVKAYRYFDWCWREKNVLYIGKHPYPLCCEASVAEDVTLTVKILSEPYRNPEYDPSLKNSIVNSYNETELGFRLSGPLHTHVRPQQLLVPGYYYAACHLDFTNGDFAETIYKEFHLFFSPNVVDMDIISDDMYLDTKIRCTPLPYPIEDYDYSMSFYDLTGRFFGQVNHYETSKLFTFLFPFKNYSVECKYKLKTSDEVNHRRVKRSLKNTQTSFLLNPDEKCVVKYFKFQGWRQPLSLKFWHQRVWAHIFVVTIIVISAIMIFSWIIHLKSTAALSGKLLTRRTLVLNGFRRRNINFANKYFNWLQSINAVLVSVQTPPLSNREAQELIKSEPDIMKDFQQFINGKSSHANDLSSLKEKSQMFQAKVVHLRKT